MPISLAQLEANTAVCQVRFAGETVAVTYRPNAFNADWGERALMRAQTVGLLVAQAESVADVVVSWDVIDNVFGDDAPMALRIAEIDEDGTPTGREIVNPRLKLLGSAFLREVLTQCQQHMQPGEDERKNSAAGSRPKAK